MWTANTTRPPVLPASLIPRLIFFLSSLDLLRTRASPRNRQSSPAPTGQAQASASSADNARYPE